MKHISLLPLFLLAWSLSAQLPNRIPPSAGEALPEWARLMYSDHPNVWEVDDAYRRWRQSHQEVKTTYTQYYKKWRRAIDPFIDNRGYESRPTTASEAAFRDRLAKLNQNTPNRNGANWSVLGPVETFNTNTGPDPLAKSSQSNIYCIDQSLSHPDVLYSGTEGSEIFKTTDKGLNWFCVSRAYDFSAVTALEVHPSDPDIAFAGDNSTIRKTTDGGLTWEIVLNAQGMSPNEILVHPAADSIVLAATYGGLYRSIDGGLQWERIIEDAVYDIEWKADDPEVVFLVQHDPAQNICRFYKSEDAGLTWTRKDNGWFFSDEAGRHDGGARLAVTKADPYRVYAVLIGEARTDDSGFIGIWRSDDAGETWTLPNPPAGGPWDENTHPNMATIGRTGGYHQGFYNLGFDASDTDPDFVMAGFLNLWYSTDGAQTFTCNGGYCGNAFNYVHPDCQEIEINGNDVWMTSDGGIEYSDDHFATHYARNRGITGSDYWGFGTGWNEDILVGGRYHNGNSGWHENWMPGEVLSLGGGEAPTGYVNPGEGRITYYSDIGGVILPESQNGFAKYFSIGRYPNESYYDAESGEMEWDPVSWNTFYVTHENKIWKTTDGGATFEILHAFGADVNARAMSFEISRSQPEVMYLFQRDESSWDPGLLWKTTDGGLTWDPLPLPPGYARRALLAVDAEDAQRVWIAYADGGNGQKIYSSDDGGLTWENLTTGALDGEHITYIMHQGGTDGGLYLGTFRTIWFRDDTMPEWWPYNEGLPLQIATCILRPFYRDHKIRLGAYGKGIWEAPFAVSSRPVAQPMVHKRYTDCPGDTLRFDDFSMLSHEGATWSWSFPGGSPSTSELRNPKVVYASPGTYEVTLTVTNPFGTSTKTIADMVTIGQPVSNEVPPLIDFSDPAHFTIINPDNGLTWEPIPIDVCDPEGDIAYYVNNYEYSSYGIDEILLPVNLDLTQMADPLLHFKVAYAPYYDGNFFIDSLKVLLSNNCESSYVTLFSSGGEELSTTSTGEGPGNFYEYQRYYPANCEEWRPVTLDLSPYAGQYVTIRFVNRSGYGNNMFLDDILLEGTLVSVEGESRKEFISLTPNPARDIVSISGTILRPGRMNLSLVNASGKTIHVESFIVAGDSWKKEIQLSSIPAGVYMIRIKDVDGHFSTQKLVITR